MRRKRPVVSLVLITVLSAILPTTIQGSWDCTECINNRPANCQCASACNTQGGCHACCLGQRDRALKRPGYLYLWDSTTGGAYQGVVEMASQGCMRNCDLVDPND